MLTFESSLSYAILRKRRKCFQGVKGKMSMSAGQLIAILGIGLTAVVLAVVMAILLLKMSQNSD
ncbi:hypothetical protein BleG1_2066 [Shouchella lehensis G1]|uniref:Uncharacterized protein n=2 Tax=Bacillaceae TaxID=186817 RepID=A0A060M3I8_9BACI|nr:hypothetical protein BleG1_2066 [Shouchella lehensis G1]KQL51802.1 hypothetical protein AN965_18755 [Alkalicoccobacillus plakortidis]MBG9784471.1 hypothetical protein [Shouchella lehensis]